MGTTSPACNALIEAESECGRLARTSATCAAYAERGKNLTANLGCTDGDDEDESVFYSIRMCERKMSVEACASAAEVLFTCLAKAPESDWRCGDTGVAVAKQAVCGTQREALDACIVANTEEPACSSFGQWYAELSKTIDCDADLAAAVASCEEMTSEPSCHSESTAYLSCVQSEENYWFCSDESGPYPYGEICAFEQSSLDGCRSCKDMPSAASAQITVTADDQYKLWVNGSLISETAPSWSSAETYTITLDPRPYRANVIAIEAKNVGASEDELDRGFVATITLGSETLVTDETWLVYEGSALDAEWVRADYDTSSFVPATSYGEHGLVAPWLEVHEDLNGAEWIWSAGADGLAAEKSDTQIIYLHRTFFVGPGGVFSGEPSSCE